WRNIEAAERLYAENQTKKLLLLRGPGIIVDMGNTGQRWMRLAAQLQDHPKRSGIDFVAPLGVDARQRQSADAVHFAAIDGKLDAGGARIARHQLDFRPE